MEDILLSKQQYKAVISRLDEISGNLITLKHHTNGVAGYLDNTDMLKLFQISSRTAQRWRKNGRLPYSKFGKKLYYKADIILERIKIRPERPLAEDQSPPGVLDPETNTDEMACKQCPLLMLLTS